MLLNPPEEKKVKNLNIGIVGGSIAGCSAAILLGRAGQSVSVFERSTGALVGRGGGMVIQPFTGSGVFNGYHNAVDLLEALESHDTIEEALMGWSANQVRSGKRLLALGEQMEKAFIWEPLDFASADAETTAAWWTKSVTFPEEFSYQSQID